MAMNPGEVNAALEREEDARWYREQAAAERYQADCYRTTARMQDNPHMLPTAEAHDAVAARHQRAAEALADVGRLTALVHDLQSGMYINCVFCGHRYGPEGDPETTMQDALTAHIRACRKHPLAKALADLDGIRRLVAEVAGADPETWPDHGNAPLAIAAWLAQLKIEAATLSADCLNSQTEPR